MWAEPRLEDDSLLCFFSVSHEQFDLPHETTGSLAIHEQDRHQIGLAGFECF